MTNFSAAVMNRKTFTVSFDEEVYHADFADTPEYKRFEREVLGYLARTKRKRSRREIKLKVSKFVSKSNLDVFLERVLSDAVKSGKVSRTSSVLLPKWKSEQNA